MMMVRNNTGEYDVHTEKKAVVNILRAEFSYQPIESVVYAHSDHAQTLVAILLVQFPRTELRGVVVLENHRR